MIHFYEAGQPNQPTFILFHGTGGDETDLIPIVKTLNPTASILGIRGEVIEGVYRRYFERSAPGIYNETSLFFEGQKIADFIMKASIKYNFKIAEAIPIGYSNGANMALHLLLESELNFNRLILLHPMYPVAVQKEKDLSQTKVFVSTGEVDPMIPLSESDHVIELLNQQRVAVTQHWTPNHFIHETEIIAAKNWL